MTIGIIGEGASDQETLTHILRSFTGDKNLLTSPLQPRTTDEIAGWGKVIDYCRSSDFRGAFTAPDAVVVIQLDTDWLRRDGVPQEWIIPNISSKSDEELIEAVKEKLVAEIGEKFYHAQAHRILFAIAVDEIECWFLGIYFDKRKAAKTTGCTDLLNTVLPDREGFFIKEKPVENYRKMCKHFKKKADLEKHSQHNTRFRIFLDEVRGKIAQAV